MVHLAGTGLVQMTLLLIVVSTIVLGLVWSEFCDDDIHDIVGGCAADVPVAGGDNNLAMENVK